MRQFKFVLYGNFSSSQNVTYCLHDIFIDGTAFALIKQLNGNNEITEQGQKMKWLEIIELRFTHSDHQWIDSQLKKVVHDVGKQANTQTIKVYRRERIDSDLSIHLHHDSLKVNNGGSPLGLCLVSALKPLGLVNHRLWIEANGS